MNWLDTETKEVLRKGQVPKPAPPKAAEFALVLILKGTDYQRLIRAIRRINQCSEADAVEMVRLPTPVTINAGLTEAEAMFGQFELICCDAIAPFLRSEVLQEPDQDGYLPALFQKVLASPEFDLVKVDILEIPETEAGEKFCDQFLGESLTKRGRDGLSISVPFKKARIMAHWARRVGGRLHCDALEEMTDQDQI